MSIPTVKPLVHLNGTSRDELYRQYSESRAAVMAAIRTLEQNEPNGRDYYPLGPEAIRTAETEHCDRVKRLAEIRDELLILLEHVADHP